MRAARIVFQAPPKSVIPVSLFLQFQSLYGGELVDGRGKRTGSVLAAADLDELLNVGDLRGHDGRVVCDSRERVVEL
jgi:hypothetical protein